VAGDLCGQRLPQRNWSRHRYGRDFGTDGLPPLPRARPAQSSAQGPGAAAGDERTKTASAAERPKGGRILVRSGGDGAGGPYAELPDGSGDQQARARRRRTLTTAQPAPRAAWPEGLLLARPNGRGATTATARPPESESSITRHVAGGSGGPVTARPSHRGPSAVCSAISGALPGQRSSEGVRPDVVDRSRCPQGPIASLRPDARACTG
jgi:hypothetical protein